jgi:hypothetical protein
VRADSVKGSIRFSIKEKTMKKKALHLILGLVFAFNTAISQATIYPLDIFTNNGQYFNDPAVDLYMDVTSLDEDEDKVDFTFYNNSSTPCTIAKIYFDNLSLSTIVNITNGPGTKFDEMFPEPGNLPSGNTIGFYANPELNIGAENPPPKDGVNAVVELEDPSDEEWVKVIFELKADKAFEDIIDELNDGSGRVGMHVIAFADGSSEGAVTTPEPATLCILGLGGLGLIRKRKVLSLPVANGLGCVW